MGESFQSAVASDSLERWRDRFHGPACRCELCLYDRAKRKSQDPPYLLDIDRSTPEYNAAWKEAGAIIETVKKKRRARLRDHIARELLLP
jgi:hypothetical protein